MTDLEESRAAKRKPLSTEETPFQIMKREASRQAVWVVSRGALALILVLIAWLIKTPVEKAIRLGFETDEARLEHDDRLAELRVRAELDSLARDAWRDYRSAALVILVGDSAQVRDGLPSLFERATASADRLYDRFIRRERVLDTDFETQVLLVHSGFERGLRRIRAGLAAGIRISIRGVQTDTAVSSLSMRQYRAVAEIGRRSLRGSRD